VSYLLPKIWGRRGLLAVLSLFVLAGCASQPLRMPTLPRETVQSFQMEGRFSLRHAEGSYSGKMAWNHSPQGDDIFLMNPFGQGAAEIQSRPGLARLVTAEQKTYEAESADQLVADVLGYPLPVAALADWLLGRPSPGGEGRHDALGRLQELRAESWRIEYDYGDSLDARALPQRLTIHRGEELELKLRIDAWSTP
jgi:outer membrane lipoprotein LolB